MSGGPGSRLIAVSWALSQQPPESGPTKAPRHTAPTSQRRNSTADVGLNNSAHSNLETGRIAGADFTLGEIQCYTGRSGALTTSCCSTDSERLHRCCHLANNFGSCRIFHIKVHTSLWPEKCPQNCAFSGGSSPTQTHDFLGPPESTTQTEC